MAPNAVDAAPKANSMVKLRNTPPNAAHTFTPVGQQVPCQRKNPVNNGFFVILAAGPPGNWCRQRQNLPRCPRFHSWPVSGRWLHCPRALRMLPETDPQL